MYGEIVQKVQGAALCHKATLEHTLAACRFQVSRGNRGAFVECGVFAGVHVAIMAHVAAEEHRMQLNRLELGERRVHAYDSFQGIPCASERDDESITALIGNERIPPGEIVSTGVSACSLAQVKENMRTWGIDYPIQYHEGWFQDTLPNSAAQFAKDGIAVLRLDGDLYESTKVCLEHLHPHVVPGGTVIIDDYALTGCRAAVQEYLDEQRIAVPFRPVQGGGGPIWYTRP